MKDKIEFNFTYYAMKLLGKNLYSSPWTAISEIVANGIDAGADKVYVFVDMADKADSTVEIFDNGGGMSYEDLCNKYVLIGRNRRTIVEENVEGKTFGRKGIGKLAALYLSPHYIISTKTENEKSTWEIDAHCFKDNDIPTLNRVEDRCFAAQGYWDECKTGTMIHLSNVDLRRIGEEKVKKLSSILADYYLSSYIACDIYVCVKDQSYEAIKFTKINKKIHFDTMYSIFDNREKKACLKEKVYLTEETEPAYINHPRETVILPTDSFDCMGKISMQDSEGNVREVDYELRGWMGVHVSLKKSILLRNIEDKDGFSMRANAIRLYVRGKLAVENLMTYIGSSQAFANYIEGEITFDVLDEDFLEDPSTSNREGYSLSDPRVQRLIEIVSKICSALIQSRSRIGSIINREKVEYFESLRKEEEELRKNEESKRKEAEREKAIVQEKYEATSFDLGSEKRRNTFLKNTLSEDQLSFSKRLHMVKINSSTIRNIIGELIERKRRNNLSIDAAWDGIRRISYCNERARAVLEYYARAEFDPKDEKIKGDLFGFIREFCEEIKQKSLDEDGRSFNIDVECDEEYSTTFVPQDMVVLIENIVNNSVKNQAKKLIVHMYSKQDEYCIDFIDDGKGLDSKANVNELFEFGKSYTYLGSGVGLYHVKEIISAMKGIVTINTSIKNGFELNVRFRR